VLSDPQKREMFDLGGDPFASGGGQGAGFGFSDIMDAFFGGGTPAGPRPRSRRGQDALVRLDLDLADTAFGATKEISVDTGGGCATCHGEGTANGAELRTCEVCRGRGEVQQVARSFLGQVMTSRPCSACGGYGTVNPNPCPDCSGEGRVRTRKTLTLKIPAGWATAPASSSRARARWVPARVPPGTSTSRWWNVRTRSSSVAATTCTARSRCR
jgi:molecular chaperone DnaJ